MNQSNENMGAYLADLRSLPTAPDPHAAGAEAALARASAALRYAVGEMARAASGAGVPPDVRALLEQGEADLMRVLDGVGRERVRRQGR